MHSVPKMTFIAHDKQVSRLAKPCFQRLGLMSGSVDGSVHIWDLNQKAVITRPPIRLLGHSRAVTGIEMFEEYGVVTSSADAKVILWDLRNASTPLNTIIPDGKSVVSLCSNRKRDILAFSTLKGMYTMNISSEELKCISKKVYTCGVWNSDYRNLYVSKTSGDIEAFEII
jgi:WD40 repeat protein